MFKSILVTIIGLTFSANVLANVVPGMIKKYPVQNSAIKQVQKRINTIGTENASTMYYQKDLTRIFLVTDDPFGGTSIILNKKETIEFRSKVDTVLDYAERTGQDKTVVLKAKSATYKISAEDTQDGAVVKICNNLEPECSELDVQNTLTITEAISTDVLYYNNPHNVSM